MIRLFKNPAFFRILYPSLIWDKKSRDSIYLTFDDGPDPLVTPWVLEQLRKCQAKATFFCLGKKLKDNTKLIARLLDEGHLVANHSFSHLNGWSTTSRDYIDDITKCDQELLGYDVKNNFFRPPYGRITRNQLKLLTDRKVVMWNRMAWDFDAQLNVPKAIRSMKKSKPGSILLFHDTAMAFENLQLILPEILKHFSNQGLALRTLND